MGKTYDFDKAVDRRKTSCLKYDFGMERKGRDDLLPLWVADMDRSWDFWLHGSGPGIF